MQKSTVDKKEKSRGAGAGVYTVPAVKKAVMILEMMALDNRGYTISEVTRLCSLPVSTANVLLYTLQECGYVQRSYNRAFSLTWKLFTEGSKLLNQAQLHELALPELERLAELTDLTIDFAIPDKYELIYVYVIQGRGDIQIQARVGQRRCFHQSAAGKAILAFFPAERTRQIAEATGLPAATPRTITSYKSLVKELEQIRLQGYPIDNEESGRGLWGAAAPVLDYKGSAVAPLGVAGTTLALSENTKVLIQEIKKSARDVSRRFGFEAGDSHGTTSSFQGMLPAGLRGIRVRRIHCRLQSDRSPEAFQGCRSVTSSAMLEECPRGEPGSRSFLRLSGEDSRFRAFGLGGRSRFCLFDIGLPFDRPSCCLIIDAALPPIL